MVRQTETLEGHGLGNIRRPSAKHNAYLSLLSRLLAFRGSCVILKGGGHPESVLAVPRSCHSLSDQDDKEVNQSITDTDTSIAVSNVRE